MKKEELIEWSSRCRTSFIWPVVLTNLCMPARVSIWHSGYKSTTMGAEQNTYAVGGLYESFITKSMRAYRQPNVGKQK